MNLHKKKKLAVRTFNVGIGRIVFLESRKNEIKEAITKQDMRDLMGSGAIMIKDVKGRRKNADGKNRGSGNIRRRVYKRKGKYVILTRKLRGYTSTLKKEGKISLEEYKKIRNQIKNSIFKSKAQLKSHMTSLKKE